MRAPLRLIAAGSPREVYFMFGDDTYTVIVENDITATEEVSSVVEEVSSSDAVIENSSSVDTYIKEEVSSDSAIEDEVSVAAVRGVDEVVDDVVDEVTDVMILDAIYANTAAVQGTTNAVISCKNSIDALTRALVGDAGYLPAIDASVDAIHGIVDFCGFWLFCLVVLMVARSFVRIVR